MDVCFGLVQVQFASIEMEKAIKLIVDPSKTGDVEFSPFSSSVRVIRHNKCLVLFSAVYLELREHYFLGEQGHSYKFVLFTELEVAFSELFNRD